MGVRRSRVLGGGAIVVRVTFGGSTIGVFPIWEDTGDDVLKHREYCPGIIVDDVLQLRQRLPRSTGANWRSSIFSCCCGGVIRNCPQDTS